MEEQLITKKELLALTGISYGSLYRWKRKNLIPHDWFIHQSTFTGQETFFPRDKILERIRRIQALKDQMSLDQIAETFSLKASPVEYTAQTAVEDGLVSRETAQVFLSLGQDGGPYDFHRLFSLYLLGELLEGGELTREEAAGCPELVGDENSGELIVLRKLGVPILLLATEGAPPRWDEGCRLVYRVSLWETTAKLKEKLASGNPRQAADGESKEERP